MGMDSICLSVQFWGWFCACAVTVPRAKATAAIIHSRIVFRPVSPVLHLSDEWVLRQTDGFSD